MNNFGDKVSFIWSVADLIRDVFKRSKYQDVILPFTVLRRIDCVLEPTHQAVLKTYYDYKGRLDNPDALLRKSAGFAFYNTSKFNFEVLCSDSTGLAQNLRAYINGFSDNMREVIERYDFNNTISKLEDAGLLYAVMEKFKNIDLHPDKVTNHEMGYIFEELLRKFNEATNENPGEHFTPREVITLMVGLLLAPDSAALKRPGIVRTVYDPCCGSGGMLTVAKETIQQANPNAGVHLFGQEVNPETFAICKSDLFMKSGDETDAENIKFGSTLSKDQHSDMRFNYLLSNPPYGKEWKMDQTAIEAESRRGDAGRFGAGLPRISDGQLLFLQHMLGRMQPVAQGGSRVAIVMNGSPLFTGDAGSGESEIRRWILENDWLEALVALPEQLFYNTGISTYIWILTNRKEPHRRNKVQLIDASALWTPMRKSLGDKRREISAGQIAEIVQMYTDFQESEHSKIFETTHFGYRKITVERPLKLNFQASEERIARLADQRGFQALATSKKKDAAQREAEEEAGREKQAAVLDMLHNLPDTLFMDLPTFEQELITTAMQSGVPLSAALRDAIFNALSERDENAEIVRNKDGYPESDSELRDTENVPLTEDIDTFFAREVLPHIPDAWINTAVCDTKDGQVGKVGYEINFNRYFYKYQPPRPLEAIEADIKTLEREIMDMLREVTQ